jgi:FAD:protein FMN transferase
MQRRRFIAIAAAAALAPGVAARALAPTRWQGIVMGARASITLAHVDAEAIIARALAEVERLEDIFSLHRKGSALSRLNHEGGLDAPPFELLECLSLCSAVHAATGGRFDPTVQPLWRLHAEAHARGREPGEGEIDAARKLAGWREVTFTPARAALARPGMALTLNGVAQGFIADRIANLLAAEGLDEVLVDMGELRALGGRPGGGDWPVTLVDPQGGMRGRLGLRARALASSSPLGTTFDQAGQIGHILDPLTGRPATTGWQLVSVTAPLAATADALSTAFCLMDRDAIEQALASFPAADLVHLS